MELFDEREIRYYLELLFLTILPFSKAPACRMPLINKRGYGTFEVMPLR